MSKASQQAGAEYRQRIADGETLLCGICGQEIKLRPTVDHIYAKELGGRSAKDNFQPAHKICNELKGSFTMVELALLIHKIHCPKEL